MIQLRSRRLTTMSDDDLDTMYDTGEALSAILAETDRRESIEDYIDAAFSQ